MSNKRTFVRLESEVQIALFRIRSKTRLKYTKLADVVGVSSAVMRRIASAEYPRALNVEDTTAQRITDYARTL